MYRRSVDYCDASISCLDSHSDGTHSVQRIHWWATDAMLHFSKSVLMKKKLIYILDGLMMSKYLANFHFWVSSSVQFNTSYNLPETHSSDFNEQRNTVKEANLFWKLYVQIPNPPSKISSQWHFVAFEMFPVVHREIYKRVSLYFKAGAPRGAW